MKKLLGIVLSLLALALPAQAQSTWETPQTATGGPTVTGGVGLCLNGSGYAVPCASTAGSATSGATGSLAFGSVTTSAPTYSNGTVNALSLDASGNLRVAATVNASVSGFAPGGAYATATAPSGSSSAATLLPAGTTVVFFNTGSNPISVNLGGSGVAAVATDNIVAAGGALPLTVGSNTYFAVWGVGGASTVVASGGAGLATGWGGGSGGSGGTVNQGTAASSGPWIETPWIGGAVNSATNGLYTNVLQGNAVLSATNGLFSNILQNNAVLSASNPLPTTPEIAGAVNSATNGLYVNLLQGNTVNASGNPIFAQLTAGSTTVGNVNQTSGTAGFSKITDGTNGPAAVKPASTAAAATDLSLVVQLSPNGVGSASTPLSVVSNQSVGSGSFATAQASPGVAATLIAAARTGVSGTGRIAAIIINMSTVPVFLGASGVTTTTGSYLAGVVGAAVVIPTTAAIYGVVGSGTGSVSVQELY